ncbi:MAG: N-formylglutamate amidohydrolase [Robiginitomaculum sp.]
MWQKSRKKRANLQEKLDAIVLRDFGAPFELIMPDKPASPLVLSSPHSGRTYPKEFQAQTSLSLSQLRLVEDSYVDQIIKPLSEHNIAYIGALFPRSYVDLNRSPNEVPPYSRIQGEDTPYPRAISPRARSGLGVIPTHIQIDQNIYAQNITDTLITRRLNRFYHTYHQALLGQINKTKMQFGKALLLDCHSLPGTDMDGSPRPNIVLGNCFGKSCHNDTLDLLETLFQEAGYSTARNHPYAGGYITKTYGRPHDNIEAIQIEINKDLYLNPVTIEPHSGIGGLTVAMENIILRMHSHLLPDINIAAQ